MAPPTTNARLRDIDPEQLSKDVDAAIRAHVFRLAFEVGLATTEAMPSNILYAVRDLAVYAKNGGVLDAAVQDYLTTICPAVWMRAADGMAYNTEEFDHTDPDLLRPDSWLHCLILVMRAALAREKLEQGLPVIPADVAVLASMAATAIRLLCKSGEIVARRDADGWEIVASEARRFLADKARRDAQ
jgi:hypothetical protein